MGKSKGRAGKGGAGLDPLGRGGAAGESERSVTTVALLSRLDSPDAAERLQAVLALSAVIKSATGAPEEGRPASSAGSSPPPQPQPDAAAVAERMRDVAEVLGRHNGYKLLLKRVTDADRQVRLHACGALCSLAAAWAPAAERLAKDGVHLAAVVLLLEAPAAEAAAAAEQSETLALALHLLCDLAKASAGAARALEDRAALERLCIVAAGPSDASQAGECARGAARLLHTATEGSARLAATLAGGPGLAALERACEAALKQTGAAGASPDAALHLLGAMSNVALLAPPQKVDPLKVSAAQLELALAVFRSPTCVRESQQLALEVLANCCGAAERYEEAAAEEAAEDGPDERTVRIAALFAGSAALLEVATGVLREAETDLDGSGAAASLAPRCCGLLDNISQNAPALALASGLLQRLWQATYRLLSRACAEAAVLDEGDMGAEGQAAGAGGNSAQGPRFEELLDAVSALSWSLARRGQQLPQGALVVPAAHVAGVCEALRGNLSPVTRANLAGLCGALASVGPAATADPADLRRLTVALSNLAADTSPVVAAQAVDSLIDVFAEEARDELFDQINLQPALQGAVPRFRSLLQDRDLRADREVLQGITQNLVAFLQYKKEQKKAHR
jgi:hypothetical protein